MANEVLGSQEIKDAINLCEDPETRGFDLQAGQTWIYPTNYPFRDYQFSIVQEALHQNTLVSLPTGLGKTFIAAVVMYNFYRWYPHGKIIFMAPTRPLVKQQIDACYDIMAIPPEVTVEITGTQMLAANRAQVWKDKRVFFITPQILQNDLNNLPDLATGIKCIVFDEAHRAKGNHAYCEVIRKLLPQNKLFRVLALSATPGNSGKQIVEVMHNLLIAHVEFRTEESPDVKPYVFEKSLETVVVPLGEKIQQVKEKYIQILEKYTRVLINYKVIQGNCSNLSKGAIFMIMKNYKAQNTSGSTSHYGEIMKSLNICVTLYHAYELLVRHGLRSFLTFYQEHIQKPLLRGNVDLHRIIDDVAEFLGPPPNIEQLPDGSYTQLSSDTKFGHPKFYKLRDILMSHFTNADQSSRVIVFFEFRESVNEAFALLLQSRPTITPRIFLGQGDGITQSIQINVVKAFREGRCNTLLSTAIGEEGLDVGEVDLIVCFDISNKSPIRMIQRMGRTGRKRDGRIIVLVTEGKEQQTLKDCLIYKNNLGNFVTNSKELKNELYQDNPIMIPPYVHPKCHKMFIAVKKPVLKKNSKLQDMLRGLSFDSPKFDSDVEIIEIEERLIKPQQYWDKENPLTVQLEKSKINFGKHLEKQRQFQPIGQIGHSKESDILVSLLRFADSKRFNIPVSQTSNQFHDGKIWKQGDIRSMFFQPNAASQGHVARSQLSSPEKEKNSTKKFPAELFTEISDYLSIEASQDYCRTCANLFPCPRIAYKSDPIDFSTMIPPDLSLLDRMTGRDWNAFAEILIGECSTAKSQQLHAEMEVDDWDFDDVEFTQIENIERETESPEKMKGLDYEAPRNFDAILESFRIETEELDDDVPFKEGDHSFAFEAPNNISKILDSFKAPQDEKLVRESIDNDDESLKFFKLSSLSDMFIAAGDNVSVDLDKTIVYPFENNSPKRNPTPDIFSNESSDLFPSTEKESGEKDEGRNSVSPILCSYEKVQLLKTKVKKKLFNKSLRSPEEVAVKPNLSILKTPHKSFIEPGKISPRKSVKANFEEKTTSSPSHVDVDISFLCDLSQFGLSKTSLNTIEDSKHEVGTSQKKETNLQASSSNIDINDICDLSVFGLDESTNKTKIESDLRDDTSTLKKPITETVKCDLDDSLFNISDTCDISAFFGEPFAKKCDTTQPSTSIRNICDESPKLSNNALANYIDLTDSDFDITPVESGSVPLTPSQMGVTQMLSYVAKKTTLTPSQKNALPRKKTLLQLKSRESPNSRHKPRIERTPKLKKSLLNITTAANSDDEFEDVGRSPVFVKPKSVATPKRKVKTTKEQFSKPERKRKKLLSDFIDDEAVVSDDDEVAVSGDESSGDDCFEASFVADETQDLDTTHMQIHYLKSVKSPPGRGKFKIPLQPRHHVSNVFSQEVDNEDNSYVNDSFCVNTEDVDASNMHDLSELDILELKLKEMKKHKRKQKLEAKSKRKRIRVIHNDDSD